MKTLVMATLCGLAASVNAGVLLTPGNVVVYRIGNATNALSSAGTAVFVDEYTSTGTLVQSIPMPTSGADAFVASGTATSEGGLTISPDGRYITLTGYNANAGTASIAGMTSTAAPRTVAVMDITTGITTFTHLSGDGSYSGNNIRSAVSDGTNIWTAGTASGTNGGVRFTTVGSTTSTLLASTPTNTRQVNIFDGQLYVTSQSGAFRASTVGAGTPTSSGQTIANLPGFSTSTGSPYQFFFADLSGAVAGVDTLYVADDSLGLEKFSLVGGNWVASGTIGASADAYRGLTASVDSAGIVTLFATRGGGSGAAGGGQLVTLADASGYNGTLAGTPTLLASALTGTSANTSFRGVGYLSVPTPGSVALLSLGGLVALRRRR